MSVLVIVGLKFTQAARVACCPLVSHGEHADGTDRQMDWRQTVTLRFPIDAANVKNASVDLSGFITSELVRQTYYVLLINLITDFL